MLLVGWDDHIVKSAERSSWLTEKPQAKPALTAANWKRVREGDDLNRVLSLLGGPRERISVNDARLPKFTKHFEYEDDVGMHSVAVNWAKDGRVEGVERDTQYKEGQGPDRETAISNILRQKRQLEKMGK